MSLTAIVILISVAAVGLFVVAISLTLIIKGRNIDSEIATNRHMRQRGITCALHDASAPSPIGELCPPEGCLDCTQKENISNDALRQPFE
ncbi:hypothetical protein FACS1894159_10080 [Bacteroidia bacterium]|nr:hypothetical protein FACS1894159_10080 [Bacteroidia bacterium]